MKKRILSVLLTLVMLISLVIAMSLGASAEETGHTHCVCGTTHKVVEDHNVEDKKTFTAVSTYDELVTAATEGGSVYLANDIELTSTITVAEGKILNLCLNGMKLSYAGSGEVSIFTVEGNATLNITDCGTTVRAGYVEVDDDGDTLLWHEGTGDGANDISYALTGGLITGGTGTVTSGTTRLGGAVYAQTGATVNLYGGNIAGNSAHYGGGIYGEGCTMNIYGGSIVGNTVGGIELDSNNSDQENIIDSSLKIHGGNIEYNLHHGYSPSEVGVSGTITMTGGTVIAENTMFAIVGADGFTMSGGTVINNAQDGIAVLVQDTGAVLSGGTISAPKGTAVYILIAPPQGHYGGDILLSGAPVLEGAVADITVGNFKASEVNIYLQNRIVLEGPLTGSTPYTVGAYLITWDTDENGDLSIEIDENPTIDFTKGWSTHMGDADPAKYFINANTAEDANQIGLVDGELWLATSYTVTTSDTNGETRGGSYSIDKTTAIAGETVTITPTPNSGYEVDTIKVYKTGDENTTVTVNDNQFTMPDYAVTVSVTFIHTHCICGETHANIGDHTEAKTVTWTEWDGVSDIVYDANNTAYVYLTANAERTTQLKVNEGYTLYLCLNGKTLTASDTATRSSAITVTKGTLVLTDCGTDGTLSGDVTAGETDDRAISSNGTFLMYGGTIRDFSINGSGGAIDSNGNVKMYGGTITNNTSTSRGGAINITGSTKSFTMYGGTISGNRGEDGGAVYLYSHGYIYGGTITNNTATSAGGAVYLNSYYSSLTLYGAPHISGNTLNGEPNNIYIQDGFHIFIDESFAPTTPVGISTAITSTDYFAIAAEGTDISDIGDYANYFASDKNIPIYEEDDALYMLYKITENPDAENNYTLSVNDTNGISYQWHSVDYEDITITYDLLAAMDYMFEYLYQDNFDIVTNKWMGFVNNAANVGYTSIYLNAGEKLTIEFDFAIPEGCKVLIKNLAGSFSAYATKISDTAYTFTAPLYCDYEVWIVSETLNLFEFEMPDARCTYGAIKTTPLNGQTTNILNAENLPAGLYVCEVTWDMGIPDEAYDDYILLSSVITISYNVTFDYGTLGSETKTIVEGTTIDGYIPVIDGYIFMGWFADEDFSTVFDFTAPITADTAIYAKFIPAIEKAVAKIDKVENNGETTYTITYTDGTVESFVIKDGADGATGNGIESITTNKVDGVTTVIIKFTDSNMADVVFKINDGATGEKGDTGAPGAAGMDGITPKLQINSETNMWEVSYDNGATWTSLNVKATGEKGDAGAPGAKGDKGDTGEKGDAGEDGVGIEKIEKTSSEGNVDTYTITLTNGTTYTFTVTNGAPGANGTNGTNGKDGADGKDGTDGVDGVGIEKIEKTASDGNVDTYTITLTNGQSYSFTVTNGVDGKDGADGTNGVDGKDGTDGVNGVDGKDGKDGTNGVDGTNGKDGKDGVDGQSPYIGENGNWWIGQTDTGVKAAAEDSKDGAVIIATTVGGIALLSNIGLILWILLKKKKTI